MEFLKTVGAKVAAGITALVVIVLAITFLRLETAQRYALLGGMGKAVAWLGIVVVVPWATFFVITAVNRLQSNLAGGLLVFAYTAIEGLALAWLYGWSIRGGLGWSFFILSCLVAGVYNLLICDWIAEKL